MGVVGDVVEDHDIAAAGDVGDRQEFLARLHGAERIDRIADDDHLRALGDRRLDLVGLQPIAVRGAYSSMGTIRAPHVSAAGTKWK